MAVLQANLPIFLLGAAVIAAFIIWARGRTEGAALERAKQLEADRKARDISDQIDSDPLPPSVAREDLKKWGRS